MNIDDEDTATQWLKRGFSVTKLNSHDLKFMTGKITEEQYKTKRQEYIQRSKEYGAFMSNDPMKETREMQIKSPSEMLMEIQRLKNIIENAKEMARGIFSGTYCTACSCECHVAAAQFLLSDDIKSLGDLKPRSEREPADKVTDGDGQ